MKGAQTDGNRHCHQDDTEAQLGSSDQFGERTARSHLPVGFKADALDAILNFV